MSLFKKRRWNIPTGLVAINIIVALVSTLVTALLTIITLLKRLD